VLAESPELLALGAQIEARSAVTHFAPGDWEYRLFIERLG
jgi:hypothetical protein